MPGGLQVLTPEGVDIAELLRITKITIASIDHETGFLEVDLTIYAGLDLTAEVRDLKLVPGPEIRQQVIDAYAAAGSAKLMYEKGADLVTAKASLDEAVGILRRLLEDR